MKATIISIRCPDAKLKQSFKEEVEGSSLTFKTEANGFFCRMGKSGIITELGTIYEPKIVFKEKSFEISGFLRNVETFTRIVMELENPSADNK